MTSDPEVALTLESALRMAQSALQESWNLRLPPIAAVVVDRTGEPLVVLRDERASAHRGVIAHGKAFGCLTLGCGGQELARRAADRPEFFNSLAPILPHGIVPVAGGVLLVRVDGSVVGAIGVSGATSDDDEKCALAGVEAVGLKAICGVVG